MGRASRGTLGRWQRQTPLSAGRAARRVHHGLLRQRRRGPAADTHRHALLAALSANLGDAVTVVGADAGLHVVAWMNGIPRAAELDLIQQAASIGLGIYPISPLYDRTEGASRPDCAGLILGYAALSVASIEKGIGLLTELTRSYKQD